MKYTVIIITYICWWTGEERESSSKSDDGLSILSQVNNLTTLVQIFTYRTNVDHKSYFLTENTARLIQQTRKYRFHPGDDKLNTQRH